MTASVLTVVRVSDATGFVVRLFFRARDGGSVDFKV